MWEAKLVVSRYSARCVKQDRSMARQSRAAAAVHALEGALKRMVADTA